MLADNHAPKSREGQHDNTCLLFLRMRQPSLDANALDQEHPETHDIIPGAWRDNANLPDMEHVYRGNVSRQVEVEVCLVFFLWY